MRKRPTSPSLSLSSLLQERERERARGRFVVELLCVRRGRQEAPNITHSDEDTQTERTQVVGGGRRRRVVHESEDGGTRRWRRRRRAAPGQGQEGRAQEEEHQRDQEPQVHTEVLQAPHVLLPLQGLHLVSQGQTVEVYVGEKKSPLYYTYITAVFSRSPYLFSSIVHDIGADAGWDSDSHTYYTHTH